MIRCTRCDKRLSRKTARVIDGRPLCSACMFTGPTCSVCRELSPPAPGETWKCERCGRIGTNESDVARSFDPTRSGDGYLIEVLAGHLSNQFGDQWTGLHHFRDNARLIVAMVLEFVAAQGIEAATAAETVELGSVHESPVGESRCAQTAPKGAI